MEEIPWMSAPQAVMALSLSKRISDCHRLERANLLMKETMVMAAPEIAQKSPYKIELIAGQEYWWCACGRSKKQPLCDGSHKVTTFKPVQYKAAETKEAWMCGCKHTAGQPFCDGTHKRI
jgi:CDGSH iron-sulfur domain-containing protein 3